MQPPVQAMKLPTLQEFREQHGLTLAAVYLLVELSIPMLECAERGEPIHWAYKEQIEYILSQHMRQPVKLNITVRPYGFQQERGATHGGF